MYLYNRMALTFQPQGASFKLAASFKPGSKFETDGKPADDAS
jgi:hypothetical protein